MGGLTCTGRTRNTTHGRPERTSCTRFFRSPVGGLTYRSGCESAHGCPEKTSALTFFPDIFETGKESGPLSRTRTPRTRTTRFPKSPYRRSLRGVSEISVVLVRGVLVREKRPLSLPVSKMSGKNVNADVFSGQSGWFYMSSRWLVA